MAIDDPYCEHCQSDSCEHVIELIEQDVLPTRIPPAPVEVVNVVRVDEMPARTGGVRTFTLTTTPQFVLGQDPRRKVARVIALTEGIVFARNQAGVELGGAEWPEAVELTLASSEEWWFASVTATTKLTVILEQWAD
jgi:hypothetical protein